MPAWQIFAVILFLICWYTGFIFLWKLGLKEKSTVKVFIGATFILGLLGLIIALVQVLNWNKKDKVILIKESETKPKTLSLKEKLNQAFLDGIISIEEYKKRMNELERDEYGFDSTK